MNDVLIYFFNFNTLIYTLQAFQHEIDLNQSRLEVIDDAARMLMQKCDPNDSATIQDDMDELHRYAQEVFARVGKFQRKLQRISQAQVSVYMSYLVICFFLPIF